MLTGFSLGGLNFFGGDRACYKCGKGSKVISGVYTRECIATETVVLNKFA